MTADHLQSVKALALGVASTAASAVVGAEVGLSSGTVATLATAIGIVVSAVTWIDKRIDVKLVAHTAEDNLRHDLILEDNRKGRRESREQTKLLASEIRHLRDLMAVAGVIPEHTPEAVRLPDESGVIPPDDTPTNEDDTQP